MATSDAGNTVEAINAAAAAISSAAPRNLAPQRRRWKDSWARYWCFGSQKRDTRIAPTSRADGGTASGRGWAVVGPAQAGLALAPPSSPASFVNSSVHSPASFTLPLSAASTGMCSPGPSNTMFTIGPYAHETQLVSPPVFSTFTTEPSTAPFTPPPELAHLTTPSSPDVPFAQLIASSLEARTRARETASPFSTSSLASPCDTPASYIPSSRHLYQGSPVGHLISSTSGFLGPETTPAVADIEFPAQFRSSTGKPGSCFPAFERFTSLTFDGPASGARSQRDAPNLETQLVSTSQEDVGMNSRSCMELGRGTDIRTTQRMCLKYAGADNPCAEQIDDEFILLSAREDEHKCSGAKGFGDSFFNGLAENTEQIFCADGEVGYWNSFGKNGYHVNTTCTASKRENLGAAQTRQSSAVVMYCDKKGPFAGDKKGPFGGVSRSTCADLTVTDTTLQVLQLYQNSTDEGFESRSVKTLCGPR